MSYRLNSQVLKYLKKGVNFESHLNLSQLQSLAPPRRGYFSRICITFMHCVVQEKDEFT